MTSTLCRFKRKKNIFKAVYYLTERIVDIAAVHNVSLATVIDLMELVSMAVKLVFMENTVIRVSIKWINLTHIVVAFNRCIVFYLFFLCNYYAMYTESDNDKRKMHQNIYLLSN